MKRWLVIRRGAVWTAAALTGLIVLIAGLSAVLDEGYLRGPFIRFLSSRAGRMIRIDGPLKTHLLSLNPRVTAERVTLGNPGWTAAGLAAQVEKVTLDIQLPAIGHTFGIQRLQMDGAKLTLMRDATGHANWQTSDPDNGPASDVPLIRILSMRRAHVALEDAYRHLRFNGTVSAEEMKGTERSRPLRIEGEGELNGRAATFEIKGDSLAGASHDRPYGFRFSERSSGSILTGSGALLRAFDFGSIDAKFEAAGEDLKDLYFLTGVTLVNTGKYRLSGKVARRGTHTEYSAAVKSGESDVLAKLSIDTSHGRPKFDADLTSQVFRLSDLGARAAGREDVTDAGKFLLSNAMLSPRAVRHGDWTVRFRARRVELDHLTIPGFSGKMKIDKGILIVDPLAAEILGGKLISRIRLDARTDTPMADLDLKFTDLQLAQFFHKGAGPPPFEGSLQARVNVAGQGRSIHEVAASANGPVTAVLTHGTMRSSLAELAGMDLRGLGLMLTKNKQETGIRCAIASFQAHDGTLIAQRLIVDTDPVLITGEGQLHLDTESLDIELRGRPKSMRLFRLRAPLLVRGTLAHPAVGMQANSTVAQTAGAVALGVALTPLAAVLAFVAPGLAKDADCTSLLEQTSASTR